MKYPTLVDMIGFQNTDDLVVRKTLDLVFNGRLQDEIKLNLEAQDQRYKVHDRYKEMYNTYIYDLNWSSEI